jgi:adenine-specific DNA-methyltransferase
MSNRQIDLAREILLALGLPKGQLNDRSALTLLALLDLRSDAFWSDVKAPRIGVTPIMDWISLNYGRTYKPNTREIIRRQTLHQFVDAGLALYNPDKPDRPVNSPAAVYQISPSALKLLKTHNTDAWDASLKNYLKNRSSLAKKYASPRKLAKKKLLIEGGKMVELSPGKHSDLIYEIVNSFAPRFAGQGKLMYLGDTGSKVGFFSESGFSELGLELNKKGKLPDVIVLDVNRNWLLLIEAVTSHGPVDAKRKRELERLFAKSKAGLVFVTAFPDKKAFNKYLASVAWETEVWVADNPDHLVHFNGKRFLGPY